MYVLRGDEKGFSHFASGNSLVYGEGALLECHIGDRRILLTNDHSPRTLFAGS